MFTGKMGPSNSLYRLGVVSAAALVMLVYLLQKPRPQGPPSSPDAPSAEARPNELLVFCAAGLRKPLEQIAADYKDEFGIAIVFQFAGSNELLKQIEINRSGDLFVAADDSYIFQAQQKDLVDEVFRLARMRPVLAFPKENPKQIKGLDDLKRADLRVGMVNPDAGAIGKVVREELLTAGRWKTIEQAIVDHGAFKPNVVEVANDLKLGSIDAAILWDSTVAQYPEFASLEPPELSSRPSLIELAVLRSSKTPKATLQFARYVAAKDKGLKVFKAQGYSVVEGDKWSAVPELTLFVGNVNRRALDVVIKDFEEREGARVNTVYNGCGILTAKMRALSSDSSAGFPDSFMACDVYYLDVVKEWFQDAVNVSQTDIVIAVPKGNPRGLEKLSDLTQPGLRVTIGHPDQCTIGVLTRQLLQDQGFYDDLLAKNVVSQTPSSALLVPSVTTGAADAALAYRTDCLAESDKIDVIAIPSPLARAVQPFTFAKASEHKELSRRLLETIRRSRVTYEKFGFGWRMDDPAPTAVQRGS